MNTCEYCTDFNANALVDTKHSKDVGNIMHLNVSVNNAGTLNVHCDATYVTKGDAGKLNISAHRKSSLDSCIVINFCPMCGRPLRDKLLFVREAKQVQSVTLLRNKHRMLLMLHKFAQNCWYDKETNTIVKPQYFGTTSDNEVDNAVVNIIDADTLIDIKRSVTLTLTEVSNVVNTWSKSVQIKPTTYVATQIKARLDKVESNLKQFDKSTIPT